MMPGCWNRFWMTVGVCPLRIYSIAIVIVFIIAITGAIGTTVATADPMFVVAIIAAVSLFV